MTDVMRSACEDFVSLGTTDGRTIAFRVALDNHEPTRTLVRSHCVAYTVQASGIHALWIPVDLHVIPFVKLHNAIILTDDGVSIRPYYYVGRSGDPTTVGVNGVAYVMFHEFPLSKGNRPDGRPVDMSGWALGPRTALHFKIDAE